MGGLDVSGLSSFANSLPSFQVPASKTLGKVSTGISSLKFSANLSSKQIVFALHSITTSLSTVND